MSTFWLALLFAFVPASQSELARAEKLYAQAQQEFERATDLSLRKARLVGEEAREIFKAEKAWSRAADVARLVGNTFLEQGQLERANKTVDEIFGYAALANNKQLEAKALMYRAVVLQREGRSEDAFGLIQRARVIFKAGGLPEDIASADLKIAESYTEIGQFRIAEGMLREAEQLLKPGRNTRLEMLIARQFAMVYNRLKRGDDALPYVTRALALTKGPDRYLTLTVAAANALLRGDSKASAAYAKRSLEVATELKNPNWVRTAYIRIGNAQVAAGQLDAAESSFRRVIDVDRQPRPRSLALTGLGKVYSARGRLEEALDCYEEAIANLDVVLGRRKVEEDRMTLVHLLIEPYQLAVDTLLQLHFRGGGSNKSYAHRAFEANERVRHRTFVEQLLIARDRSMDPMVEPDQRLRRIERQMTEISKTLVNNHLATEKSQKLRDDLKQLEMEQSIVRHDIASRSDAPNRPVGVEEWPVARVQSLVPDHGAFIEYTIGNPSVAFVITKNTFDVVRLSATEAIRERANGYIALLSEPSAAGLGAFALQAGNELYRDLMQPVIEKLPPDVTTMNIATDASTAHLPFEALTRERSGHFLIEDYAITYLPSASTYPMVLNWAPSPRSKTLLAFADPSYMASASGDGTRSLFEDEDFVATPLAHSREETSAVSRLAGLDSSDVFSGADATEDRLKRMDLSAYRILHFATHAIVSPTQPQRSALVLALGDGQADDGFLQVREIYNLRLNADLVVLSACQTGQGVEFESGDGISGLARAFFFAGARSLVATLWKVGDSETATAVTRFYEYLSQGLTKSESLRRTKIDLIRQNVAPRHWAGLVLFGEGRSQVPLQPFSGQWLMYGSAAFLAMIILAAIVYISRRPAR